MKQFYLYILILLTVLSCKKDPVCDIDLPKGRTVLFYLAGDNSLTSEVNDMHAALMRGWNPNTVGSLVIFADQRNSSPVLIKLAKRNNKTVADTLRRYSLENSASTELMKQVIADTKIIAPGESYGMVLFSHATGWLPEKSFGNLTKWSAVSENYPPIVARSVFEDNGREMELGDFAASIPDGFFEFIASEMCFMSSVETAFALRNKTNYLLAAAPEVLSPGFTPIYTTSLDMLFKPKPDLEGFGKAFFDYFNALEGAYQSAAISLVNTSRMEELAALTRQIAPSLTQEQIDQVQFYDRQGKPHVFFDFRDYIREAATPQQLTQLDELLSKIVVFKRSTPKLININIPRHSGLAVYIPQSNLVRLNNAYKETAWYKAVKN